MKRKNILIIAGVLLLGIIIFASVFFASTGFRSKFISTLFKAHESLLKSKPDYTFQAAEFYNYYMANEKEADSLYIDKIIQVSGHLAEIIQDEDGKYTLILRDNMASSGINCSMEELSDSKIENLKTEDTLTVRGICAGILLDVILTRCVIVE
jgi:hypothetical protein